MKSLIVDDARFIRSLLTDILEGLGSNVIGEACNGIEAIVQYQKHKPDVVFMDITMDKMNGIEALKKIKQINPNAKVIMCSAMGQTSYITESLQSGAIDFVVKPFAPAKIEEVLVKAFL